MTGALGQGTYFAKSATYSDSYSRAAPHAATAVPAYTAVQRHPAPYGRRRGSALQVQQQQSAPPPGPRPSFVPGAFAMLLCRVALGRVGQGSSGLRRPPPGFDSATSQDSIYAVYDNHQCIPDSCVHYT